MIDLPFQVDIMNEKAYLEKMIVVI